MNMHIVTTNFAKTLVWKHEYDVKLWHHKQRTPVQMTTTCYWVKPPMKIFRVRHCWLAIFLIPCSVLVTCGKTITTVTWSEHLKSCCRVIATL